MRLTERKKEKLTRGKRKKKAQVASEIPLVETEGSCLKPLGTLGIDGTPSSMPCRVCTVIRVPRQSNYTLSHIFTGHRKIQLLRSTYLGNENLVSSLSWWLALWILFLTDINQNTDKPRHQY
jgi:hypothetical protein